MLSGQVEYGFKAIRGQRGGGNVQVHFKASVWVNLLGSHWPKEDTRQAWPQSWGHLLPKNLDTEKQNWGHSCKLCITGALKVESVILNHLDGYQGDSTIRVVEFTFSTKEEEGNHTPTGVGRKCPKKEKATHQHGTCGRDRVGGMARDSNEEHIRTKQNYQGW